MSKRTTLPTFTFIEGTPDHLRADVIRFSEIVTEDPRRAVKVLSGFVDPGDIFFVMGSSEFANVGEHGGNLRGDNRILFAAGRLAANEYYEYAQPDTVTQTAIDKAVAVIQLPELRPLPPENVGVVALRVFASQMRDFSST